MRQSSKTLGTKMRTRCLEHSEPVHEVKSLSLTRLDLAPRKTAHTSRHSSRWMSCQLGVIFSFSSSHYVHSSLLLLRDSDT